MGLSWRYTKTKEEADDVFQEAFIRIFQFIGQVKDIAALEPWICRTTINTAINYYHKNKRHQYTEEHNGYHQQDGQYELILSHFSDELIIGLINQLPDGYRMVFNLYEIEGYSHAEIAGLLHITEATSRSQLTRAKLALKAKLKDFDVLKFEKYA